MTLQIIGFPRSNFVRTVRMVAIEKGAPFEHIPELPHSDAVNALHPLGQIPAMRHDGLSLFESVAIARYIDTVFDGPKLIPESPRDAAIVNQWVSFVQTSVDRLFLRQYVVEHMFNKDADGNIIRTEIEKALKWFPRMFAVLDEAVAPGHLGGDAFSMADCFLMPILAGVQRYPEGAEALADSAKLVVYYEALSTRLSFVETVP